MSQRKALPWLFAGTLFISALLLFLVEPMMAKMILPLLGGTPAVWNTCIVFFQAMLLAGYAYAHASSAWLSLRHQLLLHMAIMVIPIVALPLGVTEDWVPPAEGSPVVWLLLLLVVSVGLPFFALSACTPLLQKWFAGTGHARAKDPYFLYAASNLGSMLALLAYPAVIEPLLTVKKDHWLSQCWLWTIGYGLLTFLVLRCAWVVRQSPDRGNEPQPIAPENRDSEPTPGLGVWTRLRWVALAFVPSSLMLGVTAHITLDIAAIPLLWVIPLALYLLSFILVFAKWPARMHDAMILVLPPLLLILILHMHGVLTPGISARIGMHLLVLFVVALVCHGELALHRPAPRHLTEFYLWLSVGGVLGGLFNALLAPAIFTSVAEYEIGLVLACLLLPIRHPGNPPWATRFVPRKLVRPVGLLSDLLLVCLVGLVSYKLIELFAYEQIHPGWLRRLRDELSTKYFFTLSKLLRIRPVEAGAIFMFGIPLLMAYFLAVRPVRFTSTLACALGLPIESLLSRREPLRNYLHVRRPLLFGLGVGAFMISYSYWSNREQDIVYRTRNFYGLLKVFIAPESGRPSLRLTNGTTSHGFQWYHGDSARTSADCEPVGYYHRTGPIGQVFTEFSGPGAKKHIGIIGLGTGTLASYGEPGQSLIFFEIDPAVVMIAQKYFTFLENCRAKWGVVLGDARLRMKRVEDERFQMLIVDAFSSDSIPVHLLTREALELYFQKLGEGGVLALHISNRYLDLEPVLGNVADDLHLIGRSQLDRDIAGKPGKMPSQWVVLARRNEDLGQLAHDRRWKPIERRPQVGVWTDDYSNVLGVFRWK